MDFSDIGHSCEYPYCRKQDYLPFYCQACQKYYCLEHKDYAMHECANDPHKLDREQTLAYQKAKKSNKKTKVIKYQCCVEGCKKSNQVPINCQKCHHNFCLKHRYSEIHNCESLRVATKNQRVMNIINRHTENNKNNNNKNNNNKQEEQNGMLAPR